MDTAFIAIQLLGFAGFLIYSLAAYNKTRKVIFLQEASGALIIAFHTLLLGSLLGFFTNFFYMTMAYIASRHPDSRLAGKPLIAIIIGYALMVILSFEGSTADCFAIIGASIAILARSQLHAVNYRKLTMISICIWLCFNLTIGSYVGMWFNLLALIGHASNIWPEAFSRIKGLKVRLAVQTPTLVPAKIPIYNKQRS